MAGLFITGTDTGCGKTEITLGLMRRYQQQGLKVVGMKPIASGAAMTADGLRNDDALRIQAQCSIELPYHWINPYAFAPPIAPHIAAKQANTVIELDQINERFLRLTKLADLVIVEGVGGLLVPLNEQQTLADLIERLALPTLLVVGLKLGCINHALLTAEAIVRDGLRLAGWVANLRDPAMAEFDGNLATLQARIQAPLLGVVPVLEAPDPAVVADRLDGAALAGLWEGIPDPGVPSASSAPPGQTGV